MADESSDGPALRRTRLRELMDRQGIAAVLLRRPENFAWYACGGNSRVEYVSPEGVGDVVVSPEHDGVLASTIEAPRMRREVASGFDVVEFPWHEGPDDALRELV